MHIHFEKSMLIGSDSSDYFGFLLAALDIFFLLHTNCQFYISLGVCIHI